MIAVADGWAQYKNEILAKLDFAKIYADIKQARPSGPGKILGLCPFHEDHNPSFGANLTTGTWECFACCGKGSVFDFLMRRSGTGFKEVLVELGDELGVPRPESNGSGAGQVIYSYRDEMGGELFQVVRGAGKTFWQRRPNGQGGYVKGVKGVRQVLYRLPELMARPDDRVFVVEGEKDVDRLRDAGLLATTNPCGAGKWRDQYSESLKGRDVVILPDNDVPGRQHAAQVARSLGGVAASVRIIELPDLPEKGDVSNWLSAGHAAAELQDLVGKATAWTPEGDDVTGRAAIVISDRQLSDVIDETWQVLIVQNDPPRLFVSAGKLSRLVDGDNGPCIEHLELDSAYGLLVRAADWMVQRRKNLVHAQPPKDIARDILTNPHLDLPRLEAVVTTPVFDRDWRLLNQPGYHRDAKVWLHLPEGASRLDIPMRPTADDLAAARSVLVDDLLVDFPFTADSDRAHAVAALLLPFVRSMVQGPTPIHLIEAASPGSGKTLLADLIAIVAHGHLPMSTTLTRDENESRKKITAILSRGSPIIAIDNIEGGLRSSQLASAITAEQWDDRLLGVSKMVTYRNRALWLVSANNPDLSMEIARRCIRIRIAPAEEHPWKRTNFKHDPIREWTRQNRPELVWAALVAIQSWITSGEGHATQTLGSFESWSRVLGGIVRHLNLPGFLADAEEFYEAADSESSEWTGFILLWQERYGTEPIAPANLLELAEGAKLVAFAYAASSENARLAKFGKALNRLRDRKFAGNQVVVVKNKKRRSNEYRLVPQTGELFAAAEVQ